MEAAAVAKTEEKKKGVQAPSETLVEPTVTREVEAGAKAGMPLFLQKATSSPSSLLIQRQVDEEEEVEETPVQPKLAAVESALIQRQEDEEEELLQPKLTIGQPGDEYEQEADWVADTVMRMPEPAEEDITPSSINISRVQRKCAECEEEEERIHRKEAGGQTPIVTPGLEARLDATRGGGQPLSESARSFMEPRFRADLSEVQVHTGGEAQALNRELKAQAFTRQRDIYFGAGKYSPESGEGKRLLAHELTHIVQQRVGLQHRPKNTIFRHTVAPTPVSRRTKVDLFGDGTPAHPGMTLGEFRQYTRAQADWFAEPSLTSSDRDALWILLLRTTEGEHIIAGAGDLKLSALLPLNASAWTKLAAFGRACYAGSHTIRILSASAYTLTQRMALGATLIRLEALIPPEVLEITVSEVQLSDLQAGGFGLFVKLLMYWTMFAPHLQTQYTPTAGARGPEFQKILDLLNGVGIIPFLPLLGRIRNLHRFSVPMLQALVNKFADTSRSKPVHLVLHTGHDPGAFQDSSSLFEDLILNSPNLVLMLEGQGSLADITAKIPNIAATYGQPDAAGIHRIAQVMIAGHGAARSVELAGTGTPIVSGGNVSYPSESIDLDTNAAASQALLDTLLDNLDPATARVVFAGCLVGSNAVPAGTPAADIPSHLADPANQSLGTFTEQRGVARGMSPGFVTAARASVALSGATSLRDAAGNLTIQYPFDPNAFGSAAAYVASGHEPEGLFRAAVEVAATAGPVVAENQLRIRLAAGHSSSDPWWDEVTLALVKVALTGVAVGAGIDAGRLNIFANLAEIPFLARWPGDYGITVANFTGRVNSQTTVASNLYPQIAATPTFTAPPDADAQAMRLIVEQGWLALGGARTGPLIAYLDATANLTAPIIKRHLDTSAIASHSPTLFSSGAALSSGRIRLALAWLLKDPTNVDVRAFLDAQVSMGGSGPALSAAVRTELGGFTEHEILEALGRLTATTTSVGVGGASITLPSANVEINGAGTNRVRVEPNPYVATVIPYALNVRDRPSMKSTVFAWLKRGDTVRVMGFTHNWAAIDQGGRLGFVYRTFLTLPP